MNNEIDNFNNNFNDEISDIAFVLKESCCTATKFNKDKYYRLSVDAIALKNIATNEIIENEHISINKKVKETKEYFKMFKSKSIVRLKVRKEKTSDNLYIRFLLEDIVDSDYKDDDLNIILEKYLEPVYYKDDEFGDFKLDKSINSFQKNIYWLDNDISILFDNIDEETNKRSINIIRKIFADKKYIDKKLKKYAAENMLEDANSWNDDADKPHINEEEFAKLITLESISIQGYEYNITFYFDDGDIFFGHSIIVESDSNFNFTDAYI